MSETWDNRFIGLAQLVASWSKDPRRKVGAVIVRPDRTVASVGYNGFPRGMSDHPELYADRQLKLSRIIHAETNAILNARGPVHGCTMYVWPVMCCDRCATTVIQAGVARVAAPNVDGVMERWSKSLAVARLYFKEAGVAVDFVSGTPPLERPELPGPMLEWK